MAFVAKHFSTFFLATDRPLRLFVIATTRFEVMRFDAPSWARWVDALLGKSEVWQMFRRRQTAGGAAAVVADLRAAR